MSLALLFHYLMINMFRMLIHPSSGACDPSVESPRGLYRSGSMCVGATAWHQHTSNQSGATHEVTQQMGRRLLRMDVLTFETCWSLNNEIIKLVTSSWYPYAGFSLHTDTTPPQPNHNVTPTHIEPEQYNPWNNSTNKSQAPESGCINTRNMLSIK